MDEHATATEGAARRPTPLDPYPEPRQEEGSGDEKSYPPEMGTDAIAILEGRTFMLSDASGNVPPGSTGGLLHDDTRFVSRWELTLDGQPLSLLKSGTVDYYSASFFLSNPDLPKIRANGLAVRRLRFVGGGVTEQIAVVNASLGDRSVRAASGVRCGLRRSVRGEEQGPRSEREHQHRRLVGRRLPAVPVRGSRLPGGDDRPGRPERHRGSPRPRRSSATRRSASRAPIWSGTWSWNPAPCS